jgi:hypothetical protein
MSVTLIFVLLVFVLFGFLLQGVNKGLEGMQHTNMRGVLILVSLGSLGWLLGLALLAHQEFFRDWGSLPPKLLLAPGVPMLLLIGLLFTKGFTRFVQGIPRVWAVQLQVFRVVVEFILWRLFLQGKIPEQMTFEGLNFDIITGLTALPVAYFCFRKQSLSPNGPSTGTTWAYSWSRPLWSFPFFPPLLPSAYL